MEIIITVTVKPSSKKQDIMLDRSGIIVCFLKSAPENGKANRELISFLSKKLSITQSDIAITQGLIHRKKQLKIKGIASINKVFEQLGLALQQTVIGKGK